MLLRFLKNKSVKTVMAIERSQSEAGVIQSDKGRRVSNFNSLGLWIGSLDTDGV